MSRRGFIHTPTLVILSAIALVSAYNPARLGSIEVSVDEAALEQVSLEHNPAEFSVVTYNVQARPVFDDSLHKFTHISPRLNPYDIVGVQECFKDHERLWDGMEHPVKIYHGTLKDGLKLVGSGLGIAGKYPLLTAEGHNYSAVGDLQNWPASKGVLMGRFQVAEDIVVDVYTTHFVAGRGNSSMEARVTQAEELAAFVENHSPPDHAVIVMGDFNMRPSRGPEDKAENKNNSRVFAFDRLKERLGLRDASDEVVGPTRTDIDRILFRAGAGLEMEALQWQKDDPAFYGPAGDALSDHKPVMATFRIGAN